jgi:hypothetical protein
MLIMDATHMLRRGTALAIIAGGLILSACHNALDVANPRVIDESQLDNAALINTLLNSTVFAIQTNYSEFVWNSAIITDEALNATNDYRSGELSQRIVELAQGNVGPYPLLQFTRATADTSAGRIRVLVTKPLGDLRLARALAYAGYSYVFLAEFTCTAPINSGPLVSDDSLEKIALSRFNEAINDATPADTGSTRLAADTILALARVGAARASLNLNDKTGAATFAALVPPNFVMWVDYILSGNTTLENTLWTRISGQNKQLGVHPLMQNLNDRRVRYVTQSVLGHNQLTLLNIPYSPRTFSTFAASATDSTPLQAGSRIELASGLEARYILAEAQGVNPTTIALVNERRAFGNEQPLGPNDDVMAALREEKRRDFFLGARRLGDLRRYKAQGVGDFFPSGIDPTPQWGLYGSATCYIITQDEMNTNPNVASYVPPSTRPPGYSP